MRSPAGNGTMVGVLARLFHVTGDEAWHQRAEAPGQAFSGELSRNFFPLSTLLNNTELLYSAIQLVIVGEPGAADTEALLDTVRHTSAPNLVMTILSPDAGTAGRSSGQWQGHGGWQGDGLCLRQHDLFGTDHRSRRPEDQPDTEVTPWEPEQTPDHRQPAGHADPDQRWWVL